MLSLLLVSCGAHDFDDLESFINTNTNNASIANIKPPSMVIRNPQDEEYDAKNRRDPFKSIETTSNADELQINDQRDIHVKGSRNKELLEKYALSSIRMVGMLEKRGHTWALVRIPDARVLSVRKGSYMGKHQGLVVAINEDKILLEETVSDETGRWFKQKNEIILIK